MVFTDSLRTVAQFSAIFGAKAESWQQGNAWCLSSFLVNNGVMGRSKSLLFLAFIFLSWLALAQEIGMWCCLCIICCCLFVWPHFFFRGQIKLHFCRPNSFSPLCSLIGKFTFDSSDFQHANGFNNVAHQKNPKRLNLFFVQGTTMIAEHFCKNWNKIPIMIR